MYVMKYKAENFRSLYSDKKPKSIAEELLSHYFIVKGNTVIVTLNYDTFSELVDQSLGDDSVEKLNGTLFEKISEIFALIPRKYDIEVILSIRDLGDYTLQEAEKIVKDNILLIIYGFRLERRKKNRVGLSLLGGGILLLLASYFLDRLNWNQLYYDIINISGTLLVWESADIMLIERTSEVKYAKQLIHKFKSIKIVTDSSITTEEVENEKLD